MPHTGLLMSPSHCDNAATSTGLISEKNYVAGDVIFESQPWTYTILPDLIEKLCYRCLSKLSVSDESNVSTPLITCSRCQIPVYCSRKCQVADWDAFNPNENNRLSCSELLRNDGNVKNTVSPTACFGRHRLECDALIKSAYSRTEIMTFSSDFFLMITAIKKLADGQASDELSSCCPNTGRIFHTLLDHSLEMVASDSRMAIVEELKQKLQRCLTAEEMPDEEMLLHVYGVLQVNSFGIRNPYFIGIGEALYLGPSMINHSCDRNAVFLFDGIKIILKAVADISSLNEVRISYTQLFVPASVRQKRCQHFWFFACSCRFCADPKTLAELYSIQCSTSKCSGAISLDDDALLPCRQCGKTTVTEEALAEARILVRRYLEGIEEIDDRIKTKEWELDGIIDECNSLRRRCSGVLHGSNLLIGMVFDRQARLSAVLSSYGDAAKYFILSLPAFRGVFKTNDAKLALQILMAGLATFLSGDDQTAIPLLQEAVAILKISDGVDRPLCQFSMILASSLGSEFPCSLSDSSKCQSSARSLLTLLTDIRIDMDFVLLELQVERFCEEMAGATCNNARSQ